MSLAPVVVARHPVRQVVPLPIGQADGRSRGAHFCQRFRIDRVLPPGIAGAVEMHPVDRVARDDVLDDGEIVFIDPVDARAGPQVFVARHRTRCRLGHGGGTADRVAVDAPARIVDRRLGLVVCQGPVGVFGCRVRRDAAAALPNRVQVDIGVKLEAAAVRSCDGHRQRIPAGIGAQGRGGRAGQPIGPGLQPRLVEGVAGCPHLEQDDVEAGVGRPIDQILQPGALRGRAAPVEPGDPQGTRLALLRRDDRQITLVRRFGHGNHLAFN